MRTSEELRKAIVHRLDQLQIFNQQLVDLKDSKPESEGLFDIFSENEARINELESLLEYLQSPSLPKGKQ